MMVLLADTVYNVAVDPPDPDELVRYTSAKAVEQHLLDSYVATGTAITAGGNWTT